MLNTIAIITNREYLWLQQYSGHMGEKANIQQTAGGKDYVTIEGGSGGPSAGIVIASPNQVNGSQSSLAVQRKFFEIRLREVGACDLSGPPVLLWRCGG